MTDEALDRPDPLRRRVVNWLLGTSAGALVASILYPVLRFLSPPRIPEAPTNQVDAGLTNDPDLVEKDFKILRFGNEPVILIRVAEGDYRAFSATCTHLSCTVTFRPDRRLLWCYCHNGIFDLSGRNIGGPPPRPLTPYRVHVVPGPPERLVVERI